MPDLSLPPTKDATCPDCGVEVQIAWHTTGRFAERSAVKEGCACTPCGDCGHKHDLSGWCGALAGDPFTSDDYCDCTSPQAPPPTIDWEEIMNQPHAYLGGLTGEFATCPSKDLLHQFIPARWVTEERHGVMVQDLERLVCQRCLMSVTLDGRVHSRPEA